MKTDTEKVHDALHGVGGALLDVATMREEGEMADVEVQFWQIGNKGIILCAYEDGNCGLYHLVGNDGDPVEKDLEFVAELNKSEDSK